MTLSPEFFEEGEEEERTEDVPASHAPAREFWCEMRCRWFSTVMHAGKQLGSNRSVETSTAKVGRQLDRGSVPRFGFQWARWE